MFSERITRLEDEMERRMKEHPVHITYHQCWSLHRFLEHGSKEHREWLAEAILSWAMGMEKPPERQ